MSAATLDRGLVERLVRSALESQLGIELFVRRGKRLLGMTEPGQELVGIVERMLLDAKNIQ